VRKALRAPVGVVAAAAGVAPETVRKIERLDVETLTIGSLVRVAHSLGLSPADLVPGLSSRAPEPEKARTELQARARQRLGRGAKPRRLDA
jgi:hypothetical protein